MVRPATPALTSAVEPSATTRPPATTTTRSATASASSRWWVAKTTVCPRSASPRIVVQKPRRPSTSMADVGSSRRSRGGAPARASASSTRCRWPPDRAPTSRPSSPSMPAVATRSSSGHDCGKLRPHQVQHLADARLGRQPAVLQHRADAARPDGVARTPAEHADRPGRGVEQPEDGVDDGGLAGPVGAEQGDGLAGRDDQVEVGHGDGVAVADGEPGDLQGGRSDHALSVARTPGRQVVRNVAGRA